ncbi:hypothetical protein [Streptomyces chrestomyceticus]|uniref:hypothetical protein n=1 Tax=Streptomyces chrestomyceticus TaxID=68185 RepID=UPI0033E3F828
MAASLRLDAAGARRLEDGASLGRSRPVTTGLADEPGTDPESAPATGRTAHHALALPRELSDFTARGPALDRLHALAEDLDPVRPPAAVLCGQPGLGKTVFAVHTAHALALHFPDGQFALDLRGMDAQPVAPRDEARTTLSAAHEGLVRLNRDTRRAHGPLSVGRSGGDRPGGGGGCRLGVRLSRPPAAARPAPRLPSGRG